MSSIRRKMKTSRRVKRAKTNNTRKRKQKQKRNRTFRKSRQRVNRGGAGKRPREEYTMEDKWQDTRTEKDKSEQNAIEEKKDKEIAMKRVANIQRNMYLAPLGEGSKTIVVDPTEQLETTDRQMGLIDDIDAETDDDTDIEEQPRKNRRLLEGGPISFGGKKKRGISKK
jgi:hypothetical protein